MLGCADHEAFVKIRIEIGAPIAADAALAAGEPAESCRFDRWKTSPLSGRRIEMATARARHILVATEADCQKLKDEIEAGADFGELAAQHSQCPSGKNGGDLGEFSQGQMVPEFDQVVFSGEIGKVHGPVKTQFGYHLLEITSRTP
jgi:peptidyl-prolyl cis-trans isomerase C